MKYICINKIPAENNPLSKVSVPALTVYMSLLSQSSNRRHNNVIALWVHRPRNFFNPYIEPKCWNKIFSEKLTELEKAGFIKYAGKGWFKVEVVEGLYLTHSERMADSEEYYAFSCQEFLDKLG